MNCYICLEECSFYSPCRCGMVVHPECMEHFIKHQRKKNPNYSQCSICDSQVVTLPRVSEHSYREKRPIRKNFLRDRRGRSKRSESIRHRERLENAKRDVCLQKFLTVFMITCFIMVTI